MEHTFKIGDRVKIKSDYLKRVYRISDEVNSNLCGVVIGVTDHSEMPFAVKLDVALYEYDDREYIFNADELEKIDARD
jgi:hypothetical protein